MNHSYVTTTDPDLNKKSVVSVMRPGPTDLDGMQLTGHFIPSRDDQANMVCVNIFYRHFVKPFSFQYCVQLQYVLTMTTDTLI